MIDWAHWHNEPLLIGGLIFLGWLYALLAGPFRELLAGPGVPWPRRQAWSFYSALLIFYLAVGSPLDQMGERFLLSAHMLQHQLMIYPAAILFLRGLPDWMIRPVVAHPALRRLATILTRPLVCGAIFILTLSIWHYTWLYDWALQNRLVHILEHFMFFGSALFYWWPLLSPSKDLPPISYAGRMLYLIAVEIGMIPVFAYLTFSQDILYPTYEFAPRITWMTPADDQLLAGVMMKLLGFFVAMTAFGICFFRWHQVSEKKEAVRGKR
ncbi:MAG TPA: cytochrome c oxidase assembly protein [Candidatus Didemnitutus sp.]|nr:cytochrome c oxidase assembly protein [Candidatus Didemnitutus sp.]